MIFEHRGIQGETDEGDTEQSHADVTQAAVRHDAEQPKQGKALQRPAYGDPFALELDRENETDEKQRGSSLPGEARIPRGRDHLLFLDQEEGADRVRENEGGRDQSVVQVRKCHANDLVDQPEMQRSGKRADGPGQGLALFRREKRIAEKEHEKRDLPTNRERAVTIREVEGLPFAFDGPGESERDSGRSSSSASQRRVQAKGPRGKTP